MRRPLICRPVSAAPGLHDRVHLLDHNRAAAMLLLGRAIGEGRSAASLVVVIADTRDPVARSIVDAIAPGHGLDAAAEHDRVIARGEIPTAILVLDIAAAQVALAVTDPGIARALAAAPPHRRVRTVVIAAGGTSLLHLPIEMVVAEGEA